MHSSEVETDLYSQASGADTPTEQLQTNGQARVTGLWQGHITSRVWSDSGITDDADLFGGGRELQQGPTL